MGSEEKVRVQDSEVREFLVRGRVPQFRGTMPSISVRATDGRIRWERAGVRNRAVTKRTATVDDRERSLIASSTRAMFERTWTRRTRRGKFPTYCTQATQAIAVEQTRISKTKTCAVRQKPKEYIKNSERRYLKTTS